MNSLTQNYILIEKLLHKPNKLSWKQRNDQVVNFLFISKRERERKIEESNPFDYS